MTAEPIAGPEAEPDRSAGKHAPEAPLPPYAQARTSPPVPMSPTAPTPPPAYPPSGPAGTVPTSVQTPAATTAAEPPPSVADAMVEISMPPLAATALEPTPAAAAQSSPAPVLLAEPPATTTGDTAVIPVTEAAGPTEVVPVSPTAAAPTVAAAMPPALAETVTCPECGTIAQVTLNRRESLDFCRNCDYPLFWTPSKVVRDSSDTGQESLRRLPGQAGRATIASLPCPFCYEPNALSAQTCIRCHRPMHPVDEPPPPAPVYVAPPEPVVVEPAKKVAWWVWALLALGAAALIVLIVLIGTGTIG